MGTERLVWAGTGAGERRVVCPPLIAGDELSAGNDDALIAGDELSAGNDDALIAGDE